MWVLYIIGGFISLIFLTLLVGLLMSVTPFGISLKEKLEKKLSKLYNRKDDR